MDVTLKDVVFDAVDGNFPHPNTMTVKLMAGNKVLLEQEYYSVGGGFIEWKGYKPPKKNPPKYPFATMKELRQHAEQNNLSIADVILANEMSIPGRSEDEVYAFIDKITGAMVAIVKSGLNAPDGVLPGPIKLQSKAATVYKRAMDDKYEADRGIGCLSAYALAGSEENGRGHLVVTAPTGGSAGVLPALVYGLGEGGRKLSQDQIRKGMLAAAAIGYLCKHNATLSAAEGGCQAEIGVASAMAAALIAAAYDASPRVHRERGGIGPGAPSWDDLRPGCGLRTGPMHRTMRIRRREGLDRLGHREQRDRIQAPDRSGCDHHGDGSNGKGHE